MSHRSPVRLTGTVRPEYAEPRSLPRTAKDIFKLSPFEWALYNGVIWFCRATGVWRYPIPASGDLATMRTFDKIYWLYKAQFPVARATRGSHLEEFFQGQSTVSLKLPTGFRPTDELLLTAVGDLMA